MTVFERVKKVKIQFYLLDRTDNHFKKVYFKEWDGNAPVFTNSPRLARKYWNEKLAKEDMKLLRIATSPTAQTLSIKIVP